MMINVACLSLHDAALMTRRWATSDDYEYVAARHHSAAARSLAARAALRGLLAQVTGQRNWNLHADGAGKPFTDPDRQGPAISISHSGEMIAVAVGAPGIELGIDIERHGLRNFAEIAGNWFGPAEIAEVAASGAEAFYRTWTAREALAKARGTGLAGALAAGDIVGVGLHNGSWVQNGFYFHHHQTAVGYSVTIVTNVLLPPLENLTPIYVRAPLTGSRY